MSTFYTDWFACDLRSTATGSNWENLSAAENKLSGFAYARAVNGQWQGSPGHVTQVIAIDGRSSIAPSIPDSGVIDRVEVRLYFTNPQVLLVVSRLDIWKSLFTSEQQFDTRIGGIGPGIESKTMEYNEDISDSRGRTIAGGGTILPIFGYHSDEEADTFELRWSYAEFRLRFDYTPSLTEVTAPPLTF